MQKKIFAHAYAIVSLPLLPQSLKCNLSLEITVCSCYCAVLCKTSHERINTTCLSITILRLSYILIYFSYLVITHDKYPSSIISVLVHL